MGSTRRSFTAEYKASAVEFVLNDGRSVAEVARNIGVHEMTLGKWVKKARDERGEPEQPLNENERAENWNSCARALGLQGRHHPRAWKKTTVHGEQPVPAPDLIGRDFTAEGPNERWCGDI